MLKKILAYVAAMAITVFIGSHVLVFRPGFLERTTAMLVYPFYAASSRINDVVTAVRMRRKSQAELEEALANLSARYDDLFAAYLKSQSSAHFYAGIKELVDFRERYNFEQATIAKVIARNLTSQQQTLTIDRGSRHGITQDMIAIFKLQLLGKVVEVYPSHSTIMLLTDRRCKIAGFTNTTNAGGIVQGRNDSALCDMLYASHLSTIADEDFVFSSGQGLVFPEGFCLGKIVSHTLAEKALYHQITLQPLVDITSVGSCIVADRTKINLF